VISGVVFPYFSESRGRKRAIIFSVAIAGLSIFIGGLSPNIFVFIPLFGLSGFGVQGFEAVTLVYLSEISGPKFRNQSPIVLAGI